MAYWFIIKNAVEAFDAIEEQIEKYQLKELLALDSFLA